MCSLHPFYVMVWLPRDARFLPMRQRTAISAAEAIYAIREYPMMLAIRDHLATRLAAPTTERQPEPVFGRRNTRIAAALFLLAFFAELALQINFQINPLGVSSAPHFLYQAQSFLHGRWDLDLPANTVDVMVLHGQRYIAYPPFPALLMLPAVALLGLGASDILLTALISALNLCLLFFLFEQARASGLTKRSVSENIIMSVLFYFGTINLYLSLGGTMWHSAHIIAMACALLGLLLALRGHYTWAAVALACAFLSRFTAALAFPLILFLAWTEVGASQEFSQFIRSLWARRPDWRLIPWRRLLPPLAVFLVTIALFAARNALLFGSPLESGYDILLRQRYPEVLYGPFSVHYLKADLIENFFSFPLVHYTGPFNQHPVIDLLNDGVGVSVFFTTPLFLLLFWRNAKFSPIRAALWVTIGLVVAVVLVFHCAGWYQFGARYLYEAYPYAFLLMALNEVRIDWRYLALGVLGVAINYLGAREFWTHLPFIVH
jgi:hypothetical protein